MNWSAIIIAFIGAIIPTAGTIMIALMHKEEKNELDDIRLRLVRLDLLNAIQHDPENVAVIMSMAKLYFVELHGNCYMGKVFQEWANKHDINVGNLLGKEEK